CKKILPVEVGDGNALIAPAEGIEPAVRLFLQHVKEGQVVLIAVITQIAKQACPKIGIVKNKTAEIAIEGLDTYFDRYRVIAVTQVGNMILKGAFLQRRVPARSVRTLTHINIDAAAFLEIDIIVIESRRDGQKPIRGFKGGIAMIEFKTQQEVLSKDELPIAAEETNTISVRSAYPTGSWKRMYVN